MCQTPVFFAQPETNAVVVGSHCSSKLHCYRLLTCNLNGKTEFKAKGKVLQVNPDAKPKGICLIPGNTDSFLILLGGSKELSNIVAFPPSTATEQYDVSVQCCNAFICKDIAMRSLQKFDQPESSDHGFSQETALNEEDTSVVFTDGDCTPTLRLPDGSVFKSSGKTVEMEEKPTLISELEGSRGLKVNGNSKESVQGNVKLLQYSGFTHVVVILTVSLVGNYIVPVNFTALEQIQCMNTSCICV